MSKLQLLIQDNKMYTSIGSLPGSCTIVTNGNRESLQIGDVNGTFTLIPHGVPERNFIDFEPVAFWGVDHHHIFCADLSVGVLFHYDGSRLAIVKQWDLRSKTVMGMQLKIATDTSGSVCLCSADDYLLRLELEGESPYIHLTDGHLWGMAVSQDGKNLVTGREDGTLEFRAIDNLKVIKTLKPCSTPLLAMAFSPDNSQLAFSDDAWQLFVMDLASGEITSLPTIGKVIGLHYLTDGRLVIVNLSRIIRIFEGKDLVNEWNFDRELGDRYIQRSAILGDESGIVMACEHKGVAFLPFRE